MSFVGSGSHLCWVIDARPVSNLEHCFALSLILKVIVFGTWKWPINVPCSAVLDNSPPVSPHLASLQSGLLLILSNSHPVAQSIRNLTIKILETYCRAYETFIILLFLWLLKLHKWLNFKISLYLIVNVLCLTGLLFCLFAYTLQTHPKNKGDKGKNNNNNHK